MTRNRLAILVFVMVVAIAAGSDAQQTRPLSDQLRLAALMPSRATLYVQATDLSVLMKRWSVSQIRRAYYDSDSFRSFSRSHAWLKLQDRKKDFETALGFGLDEQRLGELSGGMSALALYDIGKTELVFVTEIPRPRAIATVLFKQQPQFQERSAGGTSYYVRDVATDGGRLNQQFCFAYADGKLLVATSEGLMVRALANVKSQTDDSMGGVIVKSAESVEGFACHDVTMWLDQARLNESRHFRNYWIHRNVSELAAIESGLIDLRISGTAMNERRWFKIKAGAATNAREGEVSHNELAGLVKFAPADSHLVEVHGRGASVEDLSLNIADVLFGEMPKVQPAAPGGESGDSGTSAGDRANDNRTERYGYLDNRFDRDVDDPDVQGRGSRQTASDESDESTKQFGKRLGAVLEVADPSSYCLVARSSVEQGKPFVRFDRALIITLKPDARINRQALERVIGDEFQSRFVVAGSESQFGWQEADGARFVAQSLMERGAAYAVSGRYLIFGSSKEITGDVLKAGAAKPSSTEDAQVLTSYALLRVADAKPMFDTLMSKLDRPATGASQEDEKHISFFSQNLGSLIDALSFRQVEFTQENGADLLRETVTYTW